MDAFELLFGKRNKQPIEFIGRGVDNDQYFYFRVDNKGGDTVNEAVAWLRAHGRKQHEWNCLGGPSRYADLKIKLASLAEGFGRRFLTETMPLSAFATDQFGHRCKWDPEGTVLHLIATTKGIHGRVMADFLGWAKDNLGERLMTYDTGFSIGGPARAIPWSEPTYDAEIRKCALRGSFGKGRHGAVPEALLLVESEDDLNAIMGAWSGHFVSKGLVALPVEARDIRCQAEEEPDSPAP